MTNYEKIKAMSVEQMSNFFQDWFMDCMTGRAPMNVIKWLESETESE